jgi:hypothetical protein
LTDRGDQVARPKKRVILVLQVDERREWHHSEKDYGNAPGGFYQWSTGYIPIAAR